MIPKLDHVELARKCSDLMNELVEKDPASAVLISSAALVVACTETGDDAIAMVAMTQRVFKKGMN